jgi:hypothetical protein
MSRRPSTSDTILFVIGRKGMTNISTSFDHIPILVVSEYFYGSARRDLRTARC